MPSEFDRAEFDAIHNATARGRIVVEAAGNGEENLDDEIYEGRFDRAVRDSGAIMVGAGGAGTRTPMGFSNFGSRVDVQGWGENVMTTGYGDPGYRAGGDDRLQWYTPRFAGTSSAAPIVAGAAAAVQGVRKARGLPVLTPSEMRRFLRDTGTCRVTQPDGTWAPQTGTCRVMQPDGTWALETRPIGPLPNLRRAIDAILNSRPDGLERNDDLGSATTRPRSEWVHTQSSVSPPRQVVDIWTIRLPDLTLSNTSDIDFFRIPLPDPSNPADGGRVELQECSIITGRGVLSLTRTEMRGELRVRVLPGSPPPAGEGIQFYRNGVRDDRLGTGWLLEQTIPCPRSQRDLREVTFSVGERRAGARPIEGLRYTLQMEYRVVTTNNIPAWLDLAENVDINLLMCAGPFPLCGDDPLGDPVLFASRHPYGLPECLASTCGELRYFVWPGGRLDLTFVAEVDLAFQLFDEAQGQVGEAELGPLLAETTTNTGESGTITKELKLGQLSPGVYVLRVDGPTAEYSVSFVPPSSTSAAQGIYLPLISR